MADSPPNPATSCSGNTYQPQEVPRRIVFYSPLTGQTAHLAQLREQLEHRVTRQIAAVENAPSADRP